MRETNKYKTTNMSWKIHGDTAVKFCSEILTISMYGHVILRIE